MTSALTGLHILSLFSVALWFLCQIYKDHGWAQHLIYIAKVLRLWVEKLTINAKNIPSEIITRSKAMAKTYTNNVDLRRNINWYNYQLVSNAFTHIYFSGQ